MNLTNPGVITHNEILSMYQELVDPTFTWKNFTIEEQDKILDSKRSNNCLDTSRLETMYNVRHIKDSVRNILFHYILKSNYIYKRIKTSRLCIITMRLTITLYM